MGFINFILWKCNIFLIKPYQGISFCILINFPSKVQPGLLWFFILLHYILKYLMKKIHICWWNLFRRPVFHHFWYLESSFYIRWFLNVWWSRSIQILVLKISGGSFWRGLDEKNYCLTKIFLTINILLKYYSLKESKLIILLNLKSLIYFTSLNLRTNSYERLKFLYII